MERHDGSRTYGILLWVVAMTEEDRVYESYSAFWKFARETAAQADKLPCWKLCRPREGCKCKDCERLRSNERFNREALK